MRREVRIAEVRGLRRERGKELEKEAGKEGKRLAERNERRLERLGRGVGWVVGLRVRV
jgi:hypothetical protein